MRAPLSVEIQERVFKLAENPEVKAAQIRREILTGSDGGPPTPVSYPAIQRLVRRAREVNGDLTAAGMATRILTLLNRELVRLEQGQDRVDLDRLDKISKTLRTVEPIRPKAERERASRPEAQAQTLGDLRVAAEG